MIELKEIRTYSIKERKNKISIEDFANLEDKVKEIKNISLEALVERMKRARQDGKKIVWMIGAHLIKLGLSPYIINLIKKGYVNHLAMNGAASIHDFEIALIGATSEDVPKSLETGRFGMAKESAEEINNSVVQGVEQGIGYGESLGQRIFDSNTKFKKYSLIANAYELNIPVSVHIAIGTDINHQHPSFNPGAAGKASYEDFLKFTDSVAGLNGVLLNIGSAVILPEVFLKAVSICCNLGRHPYGITTGNFDLRKRDFINNENFPGYYLRDQKSVVERIPYTMQGEGYYIQGNFKKTIPNLYRLLKS